MDAFNKRHLRGTAVRVYPGARDGRHVDTTTISEATMLSGHTAVVYVAPAEGVRGRIALSHVDALCDV